MSKDTDRAAEKGASVRALRFAQAQAVTERARGRSDEERAWLDMCALLEPRVTPPGSSDVEAKRRIVEEFQQVHADYRVSHTPTLEGQRFGLLKAVAFLALPYADHPDYRAEWKP